MKALVYENYAQNDDFESILQIKDIPEPTPKPNDAIFRVKAAALNYDDIWCFCHLNRYKTTMTYFLKYFLQ